MTQDYASLTWKELRERLSDAVEHAGNPAGDGETAARILQERAEQFRSNTHQVAERDESNEIMYFVVRGQRIGLEWSHVIEVMPIRSIMALPRCVEPLLGVCQLRGVLYPVMTLAHLMQPDRDEHEADRHIILISGENGVYGISVQEIVGLRPAGNRVIAFIAAGGQDRSWVQYLDEERTPILNVAKLYDDLQRVDRTQKWITPSIAKVKEN